MQLDPWFHLYWTPNVFASLTDMRKQSMNSEFGGELKPKNCKFIWTILYKNENCNVDYIQIELLKYELNLMGCVQWYLPIIICSFLYVSLILFFRLIQMHWNISLVFTHTQVSAEWRHCEVRWGCSHFHFPLSLSFSFTSTQMSTQTMTERLCLCWPRDFVCAFQLDVYSSVYSHTNREIFLRCHDREKHAKWSFISFPPNTISISQGVRRLRDFITVSFVSIILYWCRLLINVDSTSDRHIHLWPTVFV